MYQLTHSTMFDQIKPAAAAAIEKYKESGNKETGDLDALTNELFDWYKVILDEQLQPFVKSYYLIKLQESLDKKGNALATFFMDAFPTAIHCTGAQGEPFEAYVEQIKSKINQKKLNKQFDEIEKEQMNILMRQLMDSDNFFPDTFSNGYITAWLKLKYFDLTKTNPEKEFSENGINGIANTVKSKLPNYAAQIKEDLTELINREAIIYTEKIKQQQKAISESHNYGYSNLNQKSDSNVWKELAEYSQYEGKRDEYAVILMDQEYNVTAIVAKVRINWNDPPFYLPLENYVANALEKIMSGV